MAVDQVQYTRFDTVVPGLVEHAWVTRHEPPSREILLPDGRGLLQLVVGEDAELVDATTGARRADGSGVRGLLTRPFVRVTKQPGLRLGLQLHPSALSSVGMAHLVDTWTPVGHVVGAEAAEAARRALEDGDEHGAVRLLVDALVAARTDQDRDTERFREVLAHVDQTHGAVTEQELARFAEVTVSDVYRWAQRFLGVPPGDYLAAVRFAVFVRRAVGPGVVRPAAVLHALRWYAQAGYPPREVERTLGLTPAGLRVVEERIASLVEARSV